MPIDGIGSIGADGKAIGDNKSLGNAGSEDAATFYNPNGSGGSPQKISVNSGYGTSDAGGSNVYIQANNTDLTDPQTQVTNSGIDFFRRDLTIRLLQPQATPFIFKTSHKLHLIWV